MAYIFKGTILGALCRDCIEPLFGLKLKFYRLAPDRNVTALAVAAPKDTFTHLEDAAVAARQSLLLGEAEIDERGNFSFEFAKGYDGGPFEIDLYCGTVPRLKPGPRPPQPLQFTITTLQPSWRTMGQDSVAAWEYTVPYRYWCHIRGRFGAWTICGHVIHCETKAPIGGVRVRAFDVDWLQQDALGQDVTDGAGHFRIDYSAADFKKTIFSPSINIEWTGGPDLYFKVETLSGTVLLAEPPSRGRLADRENVGPCFCVELCLEKQPRSSTTCRCSTRSAAISTPPTSTAPSRIGAHQRRQPRLLLDRAAERAAAQDAERTAHGVPVRVPADRRWRATRPRRGRRSRRPSSPAPRSASWSAMRRRSRAIRTRSRRPGSTPTRRFPAAARSTP